MQEIVEKSLISTSIKSISKSKYINWCDQLCALVNLIPYVGGAFATEIQSIKNSVAEYKAYEFFRKFTYFIYELEELTEAQRIEFVADIEKAANGDAEAIDRLFGSIDDDGNQSTDTNNTNPNIKLCTC